MKILNPIFSKAARALGWLLCITATTVFAQPVSNSFQRPLDVSATTTNPVGEYEPTTYCGNHLGIDLRAPVLTTVRAVADGVVRYSRYLRGLGDGVHIEHRLPDGTAVVSVYYHIKAPTSGRIAEGAQVVRGQVIGRTTDITTDYGTGPHLHFSIRYGAYKSGIDSRTEKWFYPGYSSIFINGVRLCDQNDSRHSEITGDWVREPLKFIDQTNFAGTFAYVVNRVSNTISGYTLNTSSGALTSIGTPVPTGNFPFSVASDPAGKFLYVGNLNSNSISAYAVTAESGGLTPVGTVATGAFPRSIAIDPLGRFAYIANAGGQSISVFAINASSGNLTSIGPDISVSSPSSITVHPTGRFVYATSSAISSAAENTISVYSVNATTGGLSIVDIIRTGIIGLDGLAFTMAIDPSGRFVYLVFARGYSPTPANVVLSYAVNSSTGLLTRIGSAIATGNNPRSVTVDPAGKFAYVANNDSNDIYAYAIDPITGALKNIGFPVPAGISPYSVNLDPSGRFAYAVSLGQNAVLGYAVDVLTGLLTPRGVVATTGAGPQDIVIVRVQ